MAKSTAHVDKLGSFDNFRAPWQTETGEDAEIVPSTLAKLIYNLKLDKAKAADALEDAKADKAAAEAERDEAKNQAADGSGAEAQKKIDKLTADLEKVTAERDEMVSAKAAADLRAEVLGDFEAKHPKAAKYVKGETEEELKESLKSVMEDFGISEGDENEDEDEGGENEPQVHTTPKVLLNAGDRKNGRSGEDVLDFDAIAAQIDARGPFG